MLLVVTDLEENTTGASNTAFGSEALREKYHCKIIQHSVLELYFANTTADDNTAFGYDRFKRKHNW